MRGYKYAGHSQKYISTAAGRAKPKEKLIDREHAPHVGGGSSRTYSDRSRRRRRADFRICVRK